MTDREFWIAWRAAQIARAKALELERAAILQGVRAIERMLGIGEKMQAVVVSPTDSVAGIVEKIDTS